MLMEAGQPGRVGGRASEHAVQVQGVEAVLRAASLQGRTIRAARKAAAEAGAASAAWQGVLMARPRLLAAACAPARLPMGRGALQRREGQRWIEGPSVPEALEGHSAAPCNSKDPGAPNAPCPMRGTQPDAPGSPRHNDGISGSPSAPSWHPGGMVGHRILTRRTLQAQAALPA